MGQTSHSNTASRAIVLAAGKGTRMNSDLPKVVMPLSGVPLILHVLTALGGAGISRVTIVVGYRADLVRETARAAHGLEIDYVLQSEQLGTGHAVLVTEESCRGFEGSLLVTNGDMPMLQPETFRTLVDEHTARGAAATVLSALADEPFGYGRLVRNDTNGLTQIVEEKDASDEQRKIREINTGTYVFQAPQIFSVLRRVGTNNKQGEYYLPDTIALLHADGANVGSVVLTDPAEAMGANSPEELGRLEELRKVRA